ncbi:DUF805 domain-containing protein [Bifidobacterium sp. LC6]|uniref:DUF805 domain-containing protein n=1 Tax=Bifidobacterium colobi TaxID=2809026 RepID=A0ABS5UT21_9BIFI|nr:DUF805 domain-containing protein [Bifidobacterium colobi]MBT1174186.1 DUF805 domain-containing protein [Bifidobacterium colobi]
MTDPNNAPLPQVPTPGNTNGSIPQPQQNPYGASAPTPQPQYGQPSYGQPSYGQPSYEQPQYEQYGNPASQQAPAYGQPAQPSYEQPQYGQPNASAPYGGDQYGAPYATPQSAPVYSTSTPAPGVTAEVPLDQPYYGCPFPQAFLRFWKKYVVFSGRASRSEYWWWILAQLGITFVLDLLANITDDKLAFLGAIWSLAIFIPGLALAARRLHDINKPAWWLGVYYGAFVVGIILIVAGGAGAIFGGIGSLAYGDSSSRGFGAMTGGSIGLLIIGFLLILAAAITFIVFMAMPSKPEGARFDKNAIAGGYTPAPGDPAAAAPYGNPYDQQYAAPAAPAAPSVPVPPAPGFNGTVPTPDYGAPAPQPQAPQPQTPSYGQAPAPAIPEPTNPTYGSNSYGSSDGQKPWQGQ